MSGQVILAAGSVMLVAAIIQGAVGFGLNLVAAPLLAILDPSMVPGSLVLVSSAFSVLTMLRERDHTDWQGVGWSMPGQVVGTVLGTAAVALLPRQGLQLAIGGVVLGSVGLSALAWRPHPSRPALLGAGLASGVFGTAAAIGGPPIALIYQDRGGPTVRATLGAYFAAGALLSIGGLALAGHLHPEQLRLAAIMVPFTVAGLLVSGLLRRHVDRGYGRPALLVIAAASAVVLIVRNL